MEIYSVPCLNDAKTEYTHKLVKHLRKYFLKFFYKIYNDTFEHALNYHEDDRVLVLFQDKLREIVSWDKMIKSEFADDVRTESMCEWLEDLVTAVFVLNTKILATIRLSNPPKKINMEIPNFHDFVHECLANCARELWKFAYLFEKSKNTSTYQENYNKCEKIITDSIYDTIRESLPMKETLEEYLLEVTAQQKSFENFDDIENITELLNKYETENDETGDGEKDEKMCSFDGTNENETLDEDNQEYIENTIENIIENALENTTTHEARESQEGQEGQEGQDGQDTREDNNVSGYSGDEEDDGIGTKMAEDKDTMIVSGTLGTFGEAFKKEDEIRKSENSVELSCAAPEIHQANEGRTFSQNQTIQTIQTPQVSQNPLKTQENDIKVLEISSQRSQPKFTDILGTISDEIPEPSKNETEGEYTMF